MIVVKLFFVIVGVEDVFEIFMIGIVFSGSAFVELNISFGTGLEPFLIVFLVEFGLDFHEILSRQVFGIFYFG